MIQQHRSRLGAACGAIFALGLLGAAGDGGYSTTREVIATVALTLAIPFLCQLGQILRAAEGISKSTIDTVVAAGIAGIVLKLASGIPEVTQHQAHLAPSSPTYDAFTGLAAGLTVVSLIPLGLCCAGTAATILRTRVLPRWVGLGAAVTAAALVINGSLIGASFVPALPVFLLWTLLTSLYLLRASWRRPTAQTSSKTTTQAGPKATSGL